MPDPERTDAPAEPTPATEDASSGPAADPHTTRTADARPSRSMISGPPTVPGYAVLRPLGHGGMGVVYLATQTALNRLVALKFLRHGADAGDEARRRFQTEARAVASLRHPHVVQVYEVGEADGTPYCALEYIDAGTLEDRRSAWPMPAADAASLAETVARAVAAAHRAGIVHRDLKPTNVLLRRSADDGETLEPVVADFGLARVLDPDAVGQTHTGAIMGTPAYMAPEQAEGRKDVGPAADVWALGVILCDLLTGRSPFRGRTPMETFDAVRFRDPPPLPSEVPVGLAAICTKCLRKDPAERYPTAGELADDLRRFRTGQAVTAPPPTPSVPARPPGEVRRFAAHVGGTTDAAFGPDGRLWSVGMDGFVRARDADTGDVLLTCERSEGPLRCLALTPDGRFVVAGGGLPGVPGDLGIWDTGTGRLVRRLAGHASRIKCVAVSPDGRVAVTGGRWLRAWDIDTGATLWTDERCEEVAAVTFAPDGTALLSAEDGHVRIRRPTDGALQHNRFEPVGVPVGLAVALDGSCYAACGRQVVVRDRMRPVERVLVPPTSMAKAVTFAGPTLLLGTGKNGALAGYHPRTGERLFRWPGHAGEAFRVVASPDGRLALTAGADGTLILWSLPPHPPSIPPPRPDPDLLAFGDIHQATVRALAFAPDGRLVSTDAAGQVYLWDDPAAPTCLGSHGAPASAAVCHPDGQRAFTAGKIIREWDLSPGGAMRILAECGVPAHALALTGDGRRLFLGVADGSLRIFDTDTAAELARLTGHTDEVQAVGVSADGRLALSGGRDGTLRLWDVTAGTGRVLQRGLEKRESSAVAVSTDGRVGASAGFDLPASRGPDVSVCLWDLPTGELVARLTRHTGPVWSLAFSADGRLLISGSGDGTVRLWDVARRQTVACYAGHDDAVRAVALAPDGTLAASAGTDHFVRLWRVPE